MHYFKLGMMLLIINILPLTAQAKESNENLAIKYLELSKTKETLDLTIETYVQNIAAQNPSADQNKIRSFYNTYMGWNALKKQIIQVVNQTFTEQELKDIITFYKTKSGIVYAQKSPEFAQALSNIISANIMKARYKLQSPQ